MTRLLRLMVCLAVCCVSAAGATPVFQDALTALTNRQPGTAARLLELETLRAPAPGAWNNLGLALWQQGAHGPAILAWERARVANPYAAAPRENLAFARKFDQLREPSLTWYEMCSTWLPTGLWPWLAALGFWTSAALFILPGVLGWRRADWHQSLAALGATLFLMSLPGVAGAWSLTHLAVVTQPGAPLRLTPTTQGQVVQPLPAGELVRLGHRHGAFVFVRRDDQTAGWVAADQAVPVFQR